MTATDAVVGIDIGTGGVRATVLDLDSGLVLAQSSAPLATARSAEGARTQLVADWVAGVSSVTRDVIGAIDRSIRVSCVALTSAAHNASINLRGHSVSPPVVLWSDARPSSALRQVPEELKQHVRARTRVSLDSTWTLVQLRWLAGELGDAWNPVEVHLGHGAVVSWMTGEHATDPSTAAGTGFFDPIALEWCEELVEEARIPLASLPRVVDSRTVVGRVNSHAADATGLEQGTPVIVGGTDTACELLAAGIVGPGPALVKAATSGTAVTIVDAPIDNGRAIMYPHVVGTNWYLVSPTSSAWSAVSWMSRMLGEDVVELATESTPGAAGLSFLPHLDGERVPLWSREAEGGFVGLRAHHERADLARAVLEGVCFSLADALDYLESVTGSRFGDVTLSGGGLQRVDAASVLASAIGRAARIQKMAEPSRGAAVLARLAVGSPLDLRQADGGMEVPPVDDLGHARAAYQRRQRALNPEVRSH